MIKLDIKIHLENNEEAKHLLLGKMINCAKFFTKKFYCSIKKY